MPDGRRSSGSALARFAPDPEGLLARVVERARSDPAIHAVVLLGSRAREERPADEWSDTDLILVVDDADAFLADAGWPAHLGAVAISFLEATGHGRRERRVLFADGTDLDLVPVGVAELDGVLAEAAPDVLGRGYRILLDKAGRLSGLAEIVGRGQARREEWPPALVEFENVAGDVWYHAVWVARKLRRGELWVAVDCINAYLSQRLLRIVEWQAIASGDGEADRWHGGRFLEDRADPATLAALRDCFAHYDPADARRALRATMDVFRQLATDLAVRLELPYPARADEAATILVGELVG